MLKELLCGTGAFEGEEVFKVVGMKAVREGTVQMCAGKG